MTANTRRPEQRTSDREQTRQRYLRGETQAAIAADLGVTRQQVAYDLALLREAWRKAGIRDFDQAKAIELAKLDELERTYWEAWEDSRSEQQIATQSQDDSGKKHVSLRKTQQAGNPAFLQGVMSCIDRRCKILGLDAPTRIDFRIEWDALTDEQLERIRDGGDPRRVLSIAA